MSLERRNHLQCPSNVCRWFFYVLHFGVLLEYHNLNCATTLCNAPAISASEFAELLTSSI